jgi:hypothetical protein
MGPLKPGVFQAQWQVDFLYDSINYLTFNNTVMTEILDTAARPGYKNPTMFRRLVVPPSSGATGKGEN